MYVVQTHHCSTYCSDDTVGILSKYLFYPFPYSERTHASHWIPLRDLKNAVWDTRHLSQLENCEKGKVCNNLSAWKEACNYIVPKYRTRSRARTSFEYPQRKIYCVALVGKGRMLVQIISPRMHLFRPDRLITSECDQKSFAMKTPGRTGRKIRRKLEISKHSILTRNPTRTGPESHEALRTSQARVQMIMTNGWG